MPWCDIGYSDDEEQYEWFVDEAVVALYDLYGILVAVVLGELAGLADCEIANDLDAIYGAVIH